MTHLLVGAEWHALSGIQAVQPYINVVAGVIRFDFDTKDNAGAYGVGIGTRISHAPQLSSLIEGRALWIQSSEFNSSTQLNYNILWGLSFGF
jgi:hypothetical protein